MPSIDRAGPPAPSRRRLLTAIGAGALSAGIAGCLGDDGGDGGDDSGDGTTAGVDPCLYESSIEDDDCSDPRELSDDVSADTTLGSDCSEYRVTGEISVRDGATLTVEPGTRLTFESGTSLSVREGGALSAAGTCEDPIVFTGATDERGAWRGIQFYATDRDNVLRYCVVEDAGSQFSTSLDNAASVVVYDGGRAAVDNCTIRNGAGFGVLARNAGDPATLESFEHNAVTGNAAGAALTTATKAGVLSDSSTYTGNDDDRVVIINSAIGTGDSVEWDALDVRYHVSSPSIHKAISVHGDLAVAPGATVAFEEGASLRIQGDGDRQGRLDADASDGEPITFTGEEETRGHWKGIEFYNTDRDNRLANCTVEYAGHSQFSTSLDNAGNVVVYDGARVAIDECTISDGAAYGLLVRAAGDRSTLDSFEDNTVTGNAAGAVLTTAVQAGALSDSSTYTGNDDDAVVVIGSDVETGDAVEWDAIDARYRVPADKGVAVHGDLTIAPGAMVSFGEDASLRVQGGSDVGPGRLVADAADGDPITFTGEEATQGYWKGIEFYNTDRDNQIVNCTVEYGGSSQFSTRLDNAGNVVVYRESTLTITDSTLRHSGGYGLLVTDDSTVSSSELSFEGNAEGDKP